MALSTCPNIALAIVKWPVALAAPVLLPGTCIALAGLASQVISDPVPIAWFAAGFFAYVVLWGVAFKRRFMGSFFSTFEHELTHSLFAWLTLHRVVGLKATWNSGGEMRYEGRGNWLISIAPYWFPTLCVPFMIMSTLGQFAGQAWVAVGLGAAFAYHLLSTHLETHSQQTDLIETTKTFAWLFLPTANLIAAGYVISFALGGLKPANHFLITIWQQTKPLLVYALE